MTNTQSQSQDKLTVLNRFYENCCIDGFVTYHSADIYINKYRRLLVFTRCSCPRRNQIIDGRKYQGSKFSLTFTKEYSLRDKRWDCAQTDLIRQVEEKTGLQYFGNAYYGLLVFKINKEE